MHWSFLASSYIVAAADGHVRVARGHLLRRAGAGQVVVMDAAGVVAGDGGEGVQRQMPVEQTAERRERSVGQGAPQIRTQQHMDDSLRNVSFFTCSNPEKFNSASNQLA